MIFTRHGIDINEYPAVKAHLARFRRELEPKPDAWKPSAKEPEWPGRKSGAYKWYEIQDNVAYFREFSKPKIVYQEIQYHPAYALDRGGLCLNNKGFFIVAEDHWLLAVLNSPLLWWHNWRYLGHAKDEALTPQGFQMELLPIAAPPNESCVCPLVADLCAIREEAREAARLLSDWYRHSLDIPVIPTVLRDPFRLDPDRFIAVIRKARGAKSAPLSAALVRHIREEHARSVAPMARRLAEAARLEQRLSDLVNVAYGLTPAEVALMWEAAPPRMPVTAPA